MARQKQHTRQFNSQAKYAEFLLSRALVRLAGRELGTGDAGVLERQGGAPRPEKLDNHWTVSLTHSSGYICYALADCRVGIDIEWRKQRKNLSGLKEQVLSQTERARKLDFYSVWTAKEAWFKALPSDVQQWARFSDYCTSQLNIEGGPFLFSCEVGQFSFACVCEQEMQTIELRTMPDFSPEPEWLEQLFNGLLRHPSLDVRMGT